MERRINLFDGVFEGWGSSKIGFIILLDYLYLLSWWVVG
jgi:hypothetical protein